ncbi:MAG TPA: FAD-dependent oxidoreductase [Anaerolineales bacterium]|nr:FAD-dependent oxidoreductase [Anaerolineales bacterium]
MTTRSSEILIIGAGATGLGVAWDACLRGYSVTVVEQGDLGQGTSGRYHGLLHSGARYVLSDPGSAGDCWRENEVLRRIVPHTIEATGGFFLSTDHDPAEYADRWLAACREIGVPVEEIPPGSALRREPLLTPHLSRAFEVRDAALDSFELLHALAEGVHQAGGVLLTRHRVTGLVSHGHGMLARIVSLADQSTFQIEAQTVVNAAGPYAGVVAAMTGIHIPLALGKGTMIAMGSRLTHTVLNRCKPPHDGDIIVPVGTVCVLGTTDIPVRGPTDLTMEAWEIDLLMAEGQVMIPSLRRHRALRAWAGIRALYQPADRAVANRELPRAHAVLDHESSDGLPGFLTILGGKLTTFRKMAQDTVDTFSARTPAVRECRTESTPLPAASRRHYAVGDRLPKLHPASGRSDEEAVLCECEAIARRDLAQALQDAVSTDLDDIRRDLRLGMGPCQGAFCAYRAAGLASTLLGDPPPDGGFADFVQERWRGLRPLAWGRGLRQLEMLRRVQLELLGAEQAETTPG